jgi:hypothetical protein
MKAAIFTAWLYDPLFRQAAAAEVAHPQQRSISARMDT